MDNRNDMRRTSLAVTAISVCALVFLPACSAQQTADRPAETAEAEPVDAGDVLDDLSDLPGAADAGLADLVNSEVVSAALSNLSGDTSGIAPFVNPEDGSLNTQALRDFGWKTTDINQAYLAFGIELITVLENQTDEPVLSSAEKVQLALAEAMPGLVEEALTEVPAARPYVNPLTGEFDMEMARREAGNNGSLLLSIIGIEAEYSSALSRAEGSFHIRSATANL